MNLLSFVRAHRGLTASRFDWTLAFGRDFLPGLTEEGVSVASGASIRQVLDPWHKGERCQVDSLTLNHWNPRYPGKPSFFSCRRELDTLRHLRHTGTLSHCMPTRTALE